MPVLYSLFLDKEMQRLVFLTSAEQQLRCSSHGLVGEVWGLMR